MIDIDANALEVAAKAWMAREGDGYPDLITLEVAITAYIAATSPSSLADANPRIGDTGVTQEGVEYVVVSRDLFDRAAYHLEASDHSLTRRVAAEFAALTPSGRGGQ